jgi:4-hydroxy-3-polyprenylbenzoate decarboxylase
MPSQAASGRLPYPAAVYADFQSFIRALEGAGELHRVQCEVSPLLEISEITDRTSKSPCAHASRTAPSFDPDHAGLGGRALIFERVAGCDFPLVINAYGSYRRMEMALGVEGRGGFEHVAQRIASLTKPAPPRSLGEILVKARDFLPLLRIPPRAVRRGRCQEIVKRSERGEVDLTRLPMIKCWPLDGDPRAVGCEIPPEEAGTGGGAGRYITFAGMHTMHFDDRNDARPASHNIGMYRAQLLDRTHLAMHWHMHHDGAAHWRSWKQAGQRMPIAIALGGESVMPYAASAPLPPGISELLMAGFLNGRGIPMIRCKTVPLRVPANSEIIIEGWVSTECGMIGWDHRGGQPLGPGAVFEGPFGDHTGFYSLPDRYPIMEVTAITHRRNAVYPTTIVGRPPQEDYYLGKATERIFLPLLKTLIHDIDDYHLPQFGCFHNCAFIRIRKAYPLQARRVMHSVWGAGQMAWTKFIVVVDEGVDVHDEQAVLRAMFERCHFARDIEIVNGPLDILDHAAPRLGAGCKIGFDATRKIKGEEVNGIAIDASAGGPPKPLDFEPWMPSPRVWSPRLTKGRCAFVRVDKRRAGDGARAIEALWKAAPPRCAELVVAFEGSTSLRDWEGVLFHLCANVDPGRDLHIERAGPRADAAPTGRIGFDATRKVPGDERGGHPVRDFPPIIEMDAATKALVDRRWGDYGFAKPDL